jgi:hypothetical protein
MFLGRFSTFYAQDDTIPDPKEADKFVVLKRLPATTSPHSKLQQAAKVKRQSSNGNNDSGNGNGNSGSNNGNNNNGGGGSSTTDRNIALGVGLGIGIPSAIAGIVTIYSICCKPRDENGPDGEVKHKKKKEKHLHRSLPSPQDPRTQAQVPEPRGASELGTGPSQQPQRPYELGISG